MLATPGCTAVLGTAEVALGRAGQVVARPAARPGSSQAVLVVVLEPLSKPRSPIKSLLFVSRCCCRGRSCEGWGWGSAELAAASELAAALALLAGPPRAVGCAGLSAPRADPQEKTPHGWAALAACCRLVGGCKAPCGAEPCSPPAGRARPQLPPSPLQSAPLPTRGLSLTFPPEPYLIHVAFSACLYTWKKLGSFLSPCPCPTWCCCSPTEAFGHPILPLCGLFTTGSRGLGAHISLPRWPCKALRASCSLQPPGRAEDRAGCVTVPCRAGTSPDLCLWWRRWALVPCAPVRSGGSSGTVTHEPPGHGSRRCLCQKPGDFNAIRCHLILHNSCCLIR